MMEQRNLGCSDLKVSVVGLGCNNFGKWIDFDASREVMHKAIDLGVTLFDTAEMYGDPFGASEEFIGKALGVRRKDVVLATKFGGPMDGGKGGSRKYIMSAVEDSLSRLKTDWIDLYQHHFPDPTTPIDETLEALNDLVTQGKVRYIGTSNRVPWQVADASWVARSKEIAGFVSCQDEYSLLNRKVEKDLIPAMQHYGLGLLPFFPLASGLLTGKYQLDGPLPEGTRLATTKPLKDRYMTEANWGVVQKLEKFCEERDHTLLELAFSWLAAQPAVSSIIAGATKPIQIEQNVAAVGWNLSGEDLDEIKKLTSVGRPKP